MSVSGRACRTVVFVCSFSLFSGSSVLTQQDPSAVGSLQFDNENVQGALSAVMEFEQAVIDAQVELCQIPAPTFMESERAAAYREQFERLGLAEVRIDDVGNVIGVRAGLRRRPNLVMSAHLDTVFEKNTDVRVVKEGTILKGPGIGDDCRGLAVLLGVIRALNEAELKTTGTITFVGTVGEEGLGDLRGVKHLFSTELAGEIDRFVSIDGPGLGITNGAVGSIRYRITFRGPGGHSFGAFGLVSPVHALGRFINRVSDFGVPDIPKTTFTVGRVGGGTSVNSIAAEAWAEIDLRSSSDSALNRLDVMLLRAVDVALDAENKRWQSDGSLSVEVVKIGERPAGTTDPSTAIVRAAVGVSEALGIRSRLFSGSTDSNIPISLGIPAITIGGGGSGSGAHSKQETFDTANSEQGTLRATLLAVALTEP